jgi:glycosyltransferase involved in cell wall biosynthesis
MDKINQPLLSIVVPCYNEEEVFPETVKRIKELLLDMADRSMISKDSYVVFIDDGSKDNTWNLIKQYSKDSNNIKGLKLSKNEGHQNALLAGMESVKGKCDCLISIDADLQDDLGAIEKMIQEFRDGHEIVLGVRDDRTSDSFLKKFTAESYYKLMNLMGVNLEFNHADYRLMSQRALNFFLQFQERNLFIRGMVKLVGLKTSTVHYKRDERFAGESKYPISKMLTLAWNGITSFSVLPLKFITIIGFLIFLLSMVMGAYIFYVALLTDKAVPGWASTVLPIYFIGGVQLLSIGILGEYIGKIYQENKHRPHYFIEEEID